MSTEPLPAFPTYFPYTPKATWYILPSRPANTCTSLPHVPPRETWISEKYGRTPEEYLASGQRDTQQMLDILREAGQSVAELGHVLEFGCGDGRTRRCRSP